MVKFARLKVQPFFISGMPRTRTAWCSAFFSGKFSFCFHDATATTRFGIEKLVTRFASVAEKYEFVGDSDSGLLAIADKVSRRWPQAPWVLIHREAEHVTQSYQRHFQGTSYPCPELVADTREAIAVVERLYSDAKSVLGQRALEVKFEDLENEDAVKSVWDWCLPGIEFPKERYEVFQKLVVNIHPAKAAKEFLGA